MRGLALVLALALAGPASAEILALRTLPAGTIVGADDIDPGEGTLLVEVEAVLGLQTRSIIYAGRPIAPAQLAPPRLVERNQIVTLAYESGALSIRTEGRALAAGAAGEVIRVMNLASRSTVLATIRADGLLTVTAN